MRIDGLVKGTGPEVSPRFNRGDSWTAMDGPHIACEGRQVVQGVGCRVTWDSHRRSEGHDAMLMRCMGCMRSYTLSNED